MFTRSAKFYDLIYASKNYEQEAQYLRCIIKAQNPAATTILDVACGTGEHLRHFQDFARTGVDLNPELLAIAGTKFFDVSLIQADMANFDLGKQFDVVLCLFSAIGYVVTIEQLNASIACMARHVRPGGMLCVEPWFTPEKWLSRRISMRTAEQGDLKVCRIFEGDQKDKVSANILHYLVADHDKVEYFTENHSLGLFTEDEMLFAFERAALTVKLDPVGLDNRGLYIGTKTI